MGVDPPELQPSEAGCDLLLLSEDADCFDVSDVADCRGGASLCLSGSDTLCVETDGLAAGVVPVRLFSTVACVVWERVDEGFAISLLCNNLAPVVCK